MSAPGPLLIEVGRLLRGPLGECVPDAAVLVVAGKIAAAGPRESVVAPESARRLAFPGATLVPGLIDGHLHLSMDGGSDPVGALLAADPDAVAAGMAERAARLVASGVTTVRDLGDRPPRITGLRREIDAGTRPGPRILAALAPLTPPGGHCWFFGGEVTGEAAMRELVRANAEAGADVIKVMASGGSLTPGGAAMWESQFTQAEVKAVVAEAHALGLPVAAHAHGTESIEFAVDAGVDTIEHCYWLAGDAQWHRRADIARRMAVAGIAACCTAGPRDWLVQRETLGEAAARPLFDRIAWLDELGVPILPGSDGGVRNAVFGEYAGLLGMYEWLGFSPERVLELATSSAADILGLSSVTGRVLPGLDADLLVVDGDPRTSTSVLADVRLVVARGRVVA
ncbi:amidohydrolase family protein [Amycolatopsis eburnea]|uniref:Amidohydrolase family protein n=1 Tax=Amycolatopsis eburnea TaxID=2267691 RepID=A0A3R9FHN9_9PSEU|nr:amidohydrolase family protein [Amycolatopsis eburnea]RSD10766.1 amidohydrolase family protein [Amycolatopsis eburnea]